MTELLLGLLVATNAVTVASAVILTKKVKWLEIQQLPRVWKR